MKTLLLPKKVAVIIPCYNEAKSIAHVIAKFPKKDFLRTVGIELQIYVIDNNSSDDTAIIARKAGATVFHEPVKGKGNALRTGFKKLPSTIDYVVMLDGDDTYSPEEIMRLIEPLRSDFCDVVIGSRLGGRIQSAAMSRFNRIGNQLFTLAVRLFYRANVTDVLTGYFAWKKPALDALAPHLKSTGFAVEMEMITKMARLGHSMAAVPISYHPRTGQSNLHPLQDGCRILWMLLKNLGWRALQPVLAESPQSKGGGSIAKAFVPRKIVFVSDAVYPYMKGGKEKRLYEITTRLAAMGHEVHIFTMHWWNTPQKVRIEDGVHLNALCRYHKMYKGDRRTVKEGLLFGLACLKLWRIRFDVLDVDQMPFFPVFSTWLVCTLRGRKLHATWHESLSHQEWISYMGLGGYIASFIERLSTKLPHRITAASNHTKELLAHIHGRVARVELVASGIDVSLLNTVQSAAVRCDVLYAGRLVKDKHVDMLILAMGIVVRTEPDAQCLIMGQGIEKERLQQEVDSHKLQKNITFLKPLPNATDVYALMKAAKVFCSPSVREGFGITSLEALGCGTPVITVDSPGNAARHLIRHGHNGSVVPLTPESLAEAILYWIAVSQKPDTATEVANQDWHQLAQKQARIYSL